MGEPCKSGEDVKGIRQRTRARGYAHAQKHSHTQHVHTHARMHSTREHAPECARSRAGACASAGSRQRKRMYLQQPCLGWQSTRRPCQFTELTQHCPQMHNFPCCLPDRASLSFLGVALRQHNNKHCDSEASASKGAPNHRSLRFTFKHAWWITSTLSG